MKRISYVLSLVLGLILTGFGLSYVYAEEGIEPHTIEGDDAGVVTTSDEPSDAPTDTPLDSADQGGGINQGEVNPDCEGENCKNQDNIDHEGTSGEPLVVCADKNEPGCENYDPNEADPAEQEKEEAEGDEETPLWPMYVSFGALGAALISIIIINTIGRNRKK